MKPIIPPLIQALEAIQELHQERRILDAYSMVHPEREKIWLLCCTSCDGYEWPCGTRKLADEALGGA